MGEGLSRRELFRGALVLGAVATVRGGSTPLELAAPEPLFERDAVVCMPGQEHEIFTCIWEVDGPRGREELVRSTVSGGEKVTLCLTYPYDGETIPGIYRYRARALDGRGQAWTSEVVELTLSPYRFGC